MYSGQTIHWGSLQVQPQCNSCGHTWRELWIGRCFIVLPDKKWFVVCNIIIWQRLKFTHSWQQFWLEMLNHHRAIPLKPTFQIGKLSCLCELLRKSSCLIKQFPIYRLVYLTNRDVRLIRDTFYLCLLKIANCDFNSCLEIHFCRIFNHFYVKPCWPLDPKLPPCQT